MKYLSLAIVFSTAVLFLSVIKSGAEIIPGSIELGGITATTPSLWHTNVAVTSRSDAEHGTYSHFDYKSNPIHYIQLMTYKLPQIVAAIKASPPQALAYTIQAPYSDLTFEVDDAACAFYYHVNRPIEQQDISRWYSKTLDISKPTYARAFKGECNEAQPQIITMVGLNFIGMSNKEGGMLNNDGYINIGQLTLLPSLPPEAIDVDRFIPPYEYPTRAKETEIGICYHPGNNNAGTPSNISPEEEAYINIRSLGLKWVRRDLSWGGVEWVKGVYNFDKFDAQTALMKKYNLSSDYLLGYDNGAYEPEITNPDGSKTKDKTTMKLSGPFNNYAAASAAHMKVENNAMPAQCFDGAGNIVACRPTELLFEVMNEPNSDNWKPKPNAQEYAQYAATATAAIHNAWAEAKTITGGIANTFYGSTAYISEMLDAGAASGMSGIAIHPYMPNGVGQLTSSIPDLREIVLNSKVRLPLYVTEWGHSTSWFTPGKWDYAKANPAASIPTDGSADGTTADSLTRQAIYLANGLLDLGTQGLPHADIYEYLNDNIATEKCGEPKNNKYCAHDQEDNFGLFSSNSPDGIRPSGVAIKTLMHELGPDRLEFIGTYQLHSAYLRSALWRAKDENRMVLTLWTESSSGSETVRITSSRNRQILKAVDRNGNTIAANRDGTYTVYAMDGQGAVGGPIYIEYALR